MAVPAPRPGARRRPDLSTRRGFSRDGLEKPDDVLFQSPPTSAARHRPHAYGAATGVARACRTWRRKRRASSFALRQLVITLALKVVDPDHARQHVHTRFPHCTPQRVAIPIDRLDQHRELVPRRGVALDVTRDLGFLRGQERLRAPAAAGFSRAVAGLCARAGRQPGARRRRLGRAGPGPARRTAARCLARPAPAPPPARLATAAAAIWATVPRQASQTMQVVGDKLHDLFHRWLVPALRGPALMAPVGPGRETGS